MIRKLKTLEQIKIECPNYRVDPNGGIELYYPECEDGIVNYFYIHKNMVKNFGKLIELKYTINNNYFKYMALDSWNYSEKWLESIEFLSNKDMAL